MFNVFLVILILFVFNFLDDLLGFNIGFGDDFFSLNYDSSSLLKEKL